MQKDNKEKTSKDAIEGDAMDQEKAGHTGQRSSDPSESSMDESSEEEQ